MTRVCLFVAALVALALGSSAALAANASVTIRDASFQPPTVTINVGDSVTWTNQDGFGHSATGDNGAFDTGVFSTGSRSVTFGAAGTFGYFCSVHPVMRGTVRVLAQATPQPTPPPPPPKTAPPTLAPTPRPATPLPTLATPPPPTAPPSTAPPSPSPTPSPAPTATPTPSPTVAAAQVTPSPTPAATASPATTSRSGDSGPNVLVLGAVAAAAGLAGLGIYLARRGR